MLVRIHMYFKNMIEYVTHTKAFHFVEHYAHIGYFSFVFIEGHGIYAQLGGVMAIVTLFMALAGEGGPE